MLKLIRKFFANKNGKVVLWQWPNLPLWCWIICAILSRLLPQGDLLSLVGIISTGALGIWAVLEVVSGVSPFRRVLGAIVLGFTLLNLAK